jgi:hypothetical protein
MSFLTVKTAVTCITNQSEHKLHMHGIFAEIIMLKSIQKKLIISNGVLATQESTNFGDINMENT